MADTNAEARLIDDDLLLGTAPPKWCVLIDKGGSRGSGVIAPMFAPVNVDILDVADNWRLVRAFPSRDYAVSIFRLSNGWDDYDGVRDGHRSEGAMRVAVRPQGGGEWMALKPEIIAAWRTQAAARGAAHAGAPMARRDLTITLRELGAYALGAYAKSCEAVQWSAPYGTDWERALDECPERRWLTSLANALMRCGHLRHEVIVLAACAYAHAALQHAPAEEERLLRDIETVERWARGEAALDEVRAAADDASAAYAATAAAAATPAARAAIAAVTFAATAATHAVRAADDAVCAADAAHRAADHAATADARRAAHADAKANLLAITRRELGTALLDGLSAYVATLNAEASP